MKRIALTTTLILAAMFNVACNNKKKEASLQEKIHACMWDSSGQCQRAAAAYASSPAVLPIANQVLAQNPGILNGVGGTTPVVLPPGTGQGTNVGTGTAIRTASADDAAIRAMAAKVNAAIEADRNNPNSIHYDPPQTQRAPASVGATADFKPSAAAPAPGVNLDAYPSESPDGVR